MNDKDTLFALLMQEAGLGEELPENDTSQNSTPLAANIPLTLAQKRLWFQHQLEGPTTQYNNGIGLRFTGNIDLPKMNRALELVLEHHEALRTVVNQGTDTPEQKILPTPAISLTPIPVASFAEAQSGGESFVSELFDLSRDIPFRARLFAIGPDDHLLVLGQHHIANDGWSLHIMMRDLFQAYSHGSLPEQKTQYKDYALWEQGRNEAYANSVAYWKARLDSAPLYLDFPYDHPRPLTPDHSSSHVDFPLTPELIERINALASKQGTTRPMIMLAAFSALLSNYSGQQELVLGLPTANRTRQDFEDVVGLFTNTIPLLLDNDPSISFQDHLLAVTESTLEGLNNADAPFEEVVEAVSPDRTARYSPIFQVMFAYQSMPVTIPSLKGARCSSVFISSDGLPTDMHLHLEETADKTIFIRLMFNRALLETSSAHRLMANYNQLLISATDDPTRPVSELNWIAEEQTQLVLHDWQGGPEVSGDATLTSLLAQQVSKTPDATALVDENGVATSYQEVWDTARNLAWSLTKYGLIPGTPVGLSMGRSVELVIAMAGVMLAGSPWLCLDPALPKKRRKYMCEHARITHLVNAGGNSSLELAPDVRQLAMDRLDRAPEGYSPPGLETSPDDPAYITYTSGSTGHPKGIVGLHRGMANRLHWGWNAFPYGPEERLCLKTAPSFVDWIAECLSPLCAGRPAHVLPHDLLLNPTGLIDWLAEHDITRFLLVPSLLRTLMESVPEMGTKLPQLKHWTVSGEPLPADLAKAFAQACPNATLLNLYGSSEVSADVTGHAFLPGETMGEATGLAPIGTPLPGTNIYILDENMHPLPPGVPGNLFVSGVHLAQGYLHAPDLTDKAFIPSPFTDTPPHNRLFKTGDRGRFTHDGRLEFLGRNDFLITLHGLRIDPGEVEAHLRSHPSISQAIVAEQKSTGAGLERLIAFIQLAKGRPIPTADDVHTHLESALPATMIPHQYVLVDQIPLLPSGKLDRRSLPDPMELSSLPEQTGTTHPKTAMEETVAKEWHKLLGQSPNSTNQSFFYAGGHSLLALRLAAALSRATGREVLGLHVFATPTVTGLARTIEGLNDEEPLSVIPSRDHGDTPPIAPAQKGFWVLKNMEHAGRYVMSAALRIKGTCDLPAMRRAIQWVLERHPPLRTVYGTLNGEPHLRILPVDAIDLPEIDSDKESIENLLQSFATTPMDLNTEPPFRFACIKEDAQTMYMAFAVHHIAIDGWSSQNLFAEIRHGYRAFSQGASPTLPAPAITYFDYAAWNQKRLNSGEFDRDLDYWKKKWQGAPTACQFPTDRPLPPTRDAKGTTARFHIDGEVANNIRDYATREDKSEYNVLLAIFAMLLARTSGDDEIVFGIVAANRPPQTHDLIGLFANALPIRLNMGAQRTVRHCLELTNATYVEALAHEAPSFGSITQAVGAPRDMSLTPLFQTLFVYQNEPFNWSLNDMDVQSMSLDGESAPYDLTMEIQQAPDDGYNLAVTYATNLWEQSSITRLAHSFAELCRTLPESDNFAPWRKLPLCAEEEKERIIALSHGPTMDAPHRCVHQAIHEHARTTPTAPAADGPFGSLTYGELSAKANGLAKGLHDANPSAWETGQPLVAMCLPLSPEYLITWLGILTSGAAVLPLDPRWPAERIRSVMEQAKLIAYVGTDRPGFDLSIPFVDITATAPDHQFVVTQTDLDDLAYVVFTSGSTGQPKGVAVEHASLANLAQAQGGVYGLNSDTRALLTVAPAFDVAMGELASILSAGGCIVTAPFQSLIPGREYLETLERYSINYATMPATVLAAMPATKAQELPLLKTIVCGGEPLPHSAAERWSAGRTLFNAYGPSEATVCALATKYKGPNVIGRPLPGVQALVLDASGTVLPFGMQGELCLAGRGLARGYFRQPDMTAAAFVPHPMRDGRMYRTGDQAWMDANGNFHFAGRTDEQIKIRGVRVEPGETVASLESLPGVTRAVVLPDTHSEETRLIAWVTGESPDPKALLNALSDRLPEALVPVRITPLTDLPLTPNGKIDAQALLSMKAEPPPSDNVPAENSFTEKLTAIWQEVLGTDVGHDVNFFDAGGHSLRLAKVQALIEDRLNRQVEMVDLFRHTTINRLASFLSGGPDATAEEIAPPKEAGKDIAIIGMACRYPDAPDVNAFWDVIRDGRETIREFSREELLAAGVAPNILDDPDFIPRQALVDDIDLFDADFFGLSPSDAAMLDPQHRVFLQCAYHALEHAGYPGREEEKNVAVYAGSGMNQYLSVMFPDGPAHSAEGFAAMTGNDKDFLASRVSYLLNLTGPAMNVQTACSTSLVAVSLACETLRNGQADMALAGGVSLHLKPSGYLAREGLIFAKDGHCRAFDQNASGTVPGSGCGVVLLRPLEDALEANDTIYAVIKGVGLNNDGSAKAGFTAPSVEGQSLVLRRALHDAGVTPDTLGYVETHGTGTELGDPIEIAALQQAYGTRPGEADTVLGAVKANMGHADSAAGVAGLLKTALCLWYRILPPTPHFTTPNPKLRLEETPFSLLQEAKPWAQQPHPRRAAVSSFGIGGTNAHVILEETPRAVDDPDQALRKPLHAFAKARHWREGMRTNKPDERRMRDWFYAPGWQRTKPLSTAPSSLDGTWLIFTDESGLGRSLADRIHIHGGTTVSVRPGSAFQRVEDGFELRPNAKEDFESLFTVLKDTGRDPAHVVYLWGTDCSGTGESSLPSEEEMDLHFYAFLWLGRAMGLDSQNRTLHFISRALHPVQGTEEGSLLASLGYHGAGVIQAEHENITVRCIDLDGADSRTETLFKELVLGTENKIALRGAMRFVPAISPNPISAPASDLFDRGGFWWITGGLGGMGLTFAAHLSLDHGKKLLLTSRSGLPNRESWDILRHEDSPRGRAITQLMDLEDRGGEILVMAADASDTAQMEKAFHTAKARFGHLAGIIHTAGIADEAGVLRRRSRPATETVLAPKVAGTLLLRGFAIKEQAPLVLCSSLATLMPQAKYAQIGYAAANGFLDTIAERETQLQVVAINWHDWIESGMTVQAEKNWRGRHGLDDAHMQTHKDSSGLTNDEGWQILCRVLTASMPRLVVSPDDLYRMLEDKKFSAEGLAKKIVSEHDRPDIKTPYEPPRSGLEADLAAIWSEVLGIRTVGAADDFFELGGHSLLGTRLSMLVKERLGLSLGNNAVFDTPILKDMALSLGASLASETPIQTPTEPCPQAADTEEEFEEDVF